MFNWLQAYWFPNFLKKKRILLTQSKPETSQTDIIHLKNKYLHSLEEINEMRNRFARQSEKHKQHIVAKILSDFLPVIDSIQRAIESGSSEENPWKDGFQKTYEQFQTILAKYDVTLVPGKGSRFNPCWHEAISLKPSKQYKAGIVIQVIESGYLRNNQLIRAAKVVVSTDSEE